MVLTAAKYTFPVSIPIQKLDMRTFIVQVQRLMKDFLTYKGISFCITGVIV